MDSNHNQRLQAASRLVLKIGSSLLVDSTSGTINQYRLKSLTTEVARLKNRGQEVIVVSSGAIALGRSHLGLPKEKRRLDFHQAAAASGQILLAHSYHEFLGQQDIKVAQILLTLDDTENRRRYLNARNTLETLLDLGVVPIINENDSVATDEIRYGDNDRLAARVAQMLSADCLILLSDVDGLYDQNPTEYKQAKHIPTVTEINPEVESLAGETSTEFGSGGMITKLAAAKICVPAGCATVIASGHQNMPLEHLEQGGRCTWFLPTMTPQAARKQWIAGTLTPKGCVIIDGGAALALSEGRSLLPVGVIGMEGEFERGDAVMIKGSDGLDLGRGLITYNYTETQLIKGLKSRDVEKVLGYQARKTLIHRDNLVLV